MNESMCRRVDLISTTISPYFNIPLTIKLISNHISLPTIININNPTYLNIYLTTLDLAGKTVSTTLTYWDDDCGITIVDLISPHIINAYYNGYYCCDSNKDNTIGITKRDINILDIIGINKDNTIDNDTKDKRIFGTLEDYSIVVDDCDIIKLDISDINNVDNINIKLVEDQWT